MRLDGFVEVSDVLRSGVYALAKRGVVIYVGKSKSLYQRIYTHRTVANRAARGQTIPSWLPAKGFVFDQVFIYPCSLEDLDRLEAQMINLYKPKFNESLKAHGPKVLAPITLRVGGGLVVLNAVPPPPLPNPGGAFRRLGA